MIIQFPRNLLKFAAFLMVFLLMCSAQAQNATGSITGTVMDSTGAAVPNANIVVVDTQTGSRHHVTTSASGAYTVTLLAIGVYNISAEKEGFNVARKINVQLNITDVVRADLTMSVGSQQETVTVNGSNVQINTENAEVSTTVPEALVTDLPLDGRNFQNLLLLDGSAYSTQGNTDATYRGASQLTDNSTVGMGGSRSTSTGFLIDGLNNRDMIYAAAILIPSIDAVQQFKFQTKTYSAEYGGAANQVQVHFKSGSNALHGSVFEFARNNYFDAITFSPTKQPLVLRQHQYGYSLGGPIFIPKVYNGHDKSFFFANYEHFQKNQQVVVQIVVPSTAQWAGTFTKAIKDPYTGVAFPGNQIPDNRISQFAKAYKKFVYSANSGANIYNGPIATPTRSDQQNYRVDENLNARNSFFARYSIFSSTSTKATGANGTGPFSTSTALFSNKGYQGGYTRVVSSRLVNQVTFGFVHADFSLLAPTIGADDLASFGIKGGFHEQPTPEIPLVSFAGASPALSGFGVGSNYPQLDITDYYNGADSLTYVRGNHTINAGFSILNWIHAYGKGANLGTWAFNGQYSGDPFADFLLGNPYQINIIVPSPLAPTPSDAVFTYPQYTWSTYVQDQWKTSRRLTIDSGLRYEYYLPPREAQDRYDWFNFNFPGGGLCTSSQSAASSVGANGLLSYCGKSPSASPKLSFAPRVGFAYLPFAKSEKTVIRGGYGLFYDYSDEADTVNASSNYPFLGQQAFIGTAVTNILSTSTAIPDITTLRPIQLSDLSRAYLSTNKWIRPYSQNYTLTVEHTPLRNTTVSLGYQGTGGRHYPTRFSLNQPLPYDPAHPTPFTARRPYPNLGDVYPQVFALSSNYNAATVKVTHQSRSFTLLGSYVYSKSMDIRSNTYTASSTGGSQPMDARDFDRDYGPSDYDLKHRAIFSAVYHLPLGHGEQFLSHTGRTLDALIGGWQVSGIAIFQGGFPFSIAAADTQTLTESPAPRANQVGNPYPAGFHKTPQKWFDTTAFQQPAPGFLGNSRRNIIYSPGRENFDLAVLKNFQIVDRMRFQFRAEAFNAFNHINYLAPARSVQTTSTFGVISSAYTARDLQFGGKIIF